MSAGAAQRTQLKKGFGRAGLGTGVGGGSRAAVPTATAAATTNAAAARNTAAVAMLEKDVVFTLWCEGKKRFFMSGGYVEAVEEPPLIHGDLRPRMKIS